LKERQQANRQVEIVLDYREKVPYKLNRPWRDSFLDFKGFLFKVPGGARNPKTGEGPKAGW